MKPIAYFRVVNYHKDLFCSEIPVNLWQLMALVGTEIPKDNYTERIPNKYLTFLKLKDFANIKNNIVSVTDKMKSTYRWEMLAESIKTYGFICPVIVEQMHMPYGVEFIVLEGKHRVAATTLIKPHNPDFIVPCLLVEKDVNYTIFMENKPHPNPFDKNGYTLTGDIMFYSKDLEILQKFTQHLLSHPLPLDKQEATRKGDKWWCSDWWSIEILKYLMYGEQAYIGDPPPNRLKNNDLWNKETIMEAGRQKIEMEKKLHSISSNIENLLVCEVGRGIDIALAIMKHQWKNIYCYDLNPLMGEELISYFKVRLGLPIHFQQLNTCDYKFSDINVPTVVIANKTKINKEQVAEILNNKNIMHFICNGQFIERIDQW